MGIVGLYGILVPSDGRAEIVHVNTGTVLSNASRLPEPVAHFDEALQLKTDFAKVQTGLARLRAVR